MASKHSHGAAHEGSKAIRDWNGLRGAAVDGYSDGILCLALIEIVERSNRPSVIGPLNEKDAGRAALFLIQSALYRLHLTVIRAYAPVRRGDRHLSAAIDFLCVPGRLAEVEDPDSAAHLGDAVQKFQALANDKRLPPLKHMRDKLMAHWADVDPSISTPRYDELFGFARETSAVWEHLAMGTRSIMVPIANQIDAYRESADAFWSAWEQPNG